MQTLQEDNYYAFGMKHQGYNNVVSSNANNVAQKILYNGKEYQDELSLNWYDYGARNYDPTVGRWFNVDPLVEKYRRCSTYNYCMNNPVYFVDPDGMRTVQSDYNWSTGEYRSGSYEKAMANQGYNPDGSTIGSSDRSNFYSKQEILSLLNIGDNGGGNNLGEPPVHFFNAKDFDMLRIFDLANKKGAYKEGDNVFYIYAHGGIGWMADERPGMKPSEYNSIRGVNSFDEIVSEASPAYKKAIQNNRPFTMFLLMCNSAPENMDNSLIIKLSKKYPQSTFIGYDGFVAWQGSYIPSTVNSQRLQDTNNIPLKDGKVVIYKGGTETFRMLYKDVKSIILWAK